MRLKRMLGNHINIFSSVSVVLILLNSFTIVSFSQATQLFLLSVCTIIISYQIYKYSRSLSFFFPTFLFAISIIISLFFINNSMFKVVDYSKPIILKNDSVTFAPNENGIFLTGFETHGLQNLEIATISASTSDEVLISNYELKGSGEIIPLGIARDNYSDQEIEISFSKIQKSNLELYPMYSIDTSMPDKVFDFIRLKTELLIISHIKVILVLLSVSLCLTYLYYFQTRYFTEFVLLSLLLSYIFIALHLFPQQIKIVLNFAHYAYAIQILFMYLLKKRAIAIKKPVFIIGGILLAMTLIKAPHFTNDFSGSHSLKYAAILEPAVNMLKTSPFTYVSRYRGEAFSDPQFFGELDYFESFPALIWLNYLGLKVFSIDNLPLISRIIMHSIGLITLIVMYQSLKQISKSTEYALSATFLFSLQIMFLFTSFVTVNELILLSGVLFAILLILKDESKLFVVSGSILSLTYLVKASVVLWGFLPVLSMLLVSSSSKQSFYKQLLLLGFGSAVTYASFFLFIRPLPSYTTIQASISFLFFFLVLFLIFSSNISSYLSKFSLARMNKTFLISSFGLLSISTIFIVKQITAYIPEFTSIDIPSTIFSLLPTVFNKYFWFYLPKYTDVLLLFSLGLFSLVIFKNKNKSLTLFIFSLFLSLSIYAVLASKVLYFHNYYFLPFFFLLSLLLPLIVLLNKKLFIPFCILIVAFFSPMVATKGYELLSEKRTGFFQVVKYLQNHTTASDFILDDSAAAAVGIFLEASFTNSNTTYFRDAMQKSSLFEAADNHNLKYVLTFNSTPNIEKIAQASESSFEVLSRDDFISSQGTAKAENHDSKELDSIKQQLHLVKNFGAYKIYSFKELENDEKK